MGVYSFKDVLCTVSGPGGESIRIGQALAGVSDDGISVVAAEDKNTMAIGADGTPMHSLHAGDPATITIRMQKTSPVNAMLMQMYNYQRMSGAYWGQNTIVVSNFVLGDQVTSQAVAFKKVPDYNNPKIAGVVEWVFDAGICFEFINEGPAVSP